MVEHKIMDMRATSSKQNKVFIISIIRKKPSDNDVNSEDNHYLCLNSKTQICI